MYVSMYVYMYVCFVFMMENIQKLETCPNSGIQVIYLFYKFVILLLYRKFGKSYEISTIAGNPRKLLEILCKSRKSEKNAKC